MNSITMFHVEQHAAALENKIAADLSSKMNIENETAVHRAGQHISKPDDRSPGIAAAQEAVKNVPKEMQPVMTMTPEERDSNAEKLKKSMEERMNM